MLLVKLILFLFQHHRLQMGVSEQMSILALQPLEEMDRLRILGILVMETLLQVLTQHINMPLLAIIRLLLQLLMEMVVLIQTQFH